MKLSFILKCWPNSFFAFLLPLLLLYKHKSKWSWYRYKVIILSTNDNHVIPFQWSLFISTIFFAADRSRSCSAIIYTYYSFLCKRFQKKKSLSPRTLVGPKIYTFLITNQITICTKATWLSAFRRGNNRRFSSSDQSMKLARSCWKTLGKRRKENVVKSFA